MKATVAHINAASGRRVVLVVFIPDLQPNGLVS
jgi:hypothetical protein